MLILGGQKWPKSDQKSRFRQKSRKEAFFAKKSLFIGFLAKPPGYVRDLVI